jgi:PAS domain-containing protein
VHPDDLAVVAEAYATSTERLVPGKAEFRARHADGHYIWVESVGNPLFDEEGELIGAIFVTRDISKRKRAEERLERLNRCFLELGTDPLENITMIVDAGREILEAAHMHYSRMEKGRLHSYLTSTDDRGFKVIDRPEGLICQTTIGEGREGPVAIEDITVFGYENFAPEIREEGFRSYLGYPIKIDGRTVGCLGLFRREAGGFSGQETDLLGMLARAIILEEERLAHLEELRDFIDIASHELRHPMTVIKGYAATLRSYLDRMDEKTREEVLDDIDKSVDRMERLVRQLLDTARIERGKLTVKKTAVDMAALLERVVREVREMREGVPAGHISLLVSKDLDRVEADPERIARVLVILIENAVNYSPGGSPVEVEAAPVGEKGVMIAVLDRGWGVPEDERERIFERFFQVEEAVHHSKPGIGLGLYIAREIVEAHGGKIWCEPRGGGGSIFRFTLP